MTGRDQVEADERGTRLWSREAPDVVLL